MSEKRWNEIDEVTRMFHEHYERRLAEEGLHPGVQAVPGEPPTPDAPTPPEGYEIVDRSVEPGGTLVDAGTWRICYPERPGDGAWRRPSTGAGVWHLSEFPEDAILARPIHAERWTPDVVDEGPSNRALCDVGVQMDSLAAEAIARETDRRILADQPASPWVRASDRQPPDDGRYVLICTPSGEEMYGRGLVRDGNRWLDVTAVDRMADEIMEHRRHVAKLMQRVDKSESECRELRMDNADLVRRIEELEKKQSPVELTFSELVRMAVRDQSFDKEA